MAAIRERREVAFYESVYIARPDISAAQVEALTQRLTEIIETSGGRVTKNEYWGLKNLAYRIKKNRKGHYSAAQYRRSERGGRRIRAQYEA